jgi:serine/threonine-protein kinase
MTVTARIGRYSLLRLLGRGARTQVWQARDERSGTLVALKLAASGDEAGRMRLRREAEVAALLGPHPNIARVDDYIEHDGVACLCIELLEPAAATLRLAEFGQLLRAIKHSHGRGVLHCDIKPANLLRSGEVLKLADFGIARRPGEAGPAHGTPGYMAPEQMRALPLGPSSDLYCAGVILYELLAGTRLFTGSAFDVMRSVLAPDVAALPRLPSARFEAIVRRALAPEPAGRYQTAGQFLRDFLQEMP